MLFNRLIPDSHWHIPAYMAGIEFLFRGQKYLVIFGACYLLLVLLLAIPYVQRHVVYLNAIKIPLFANFNFPEKYGLAPNRTVNLRLQTPDNETIGAWFILSDPYYHSLASIPNEPSEHVKSALKHSPAVLFLHGNSGTRAFSARIRHYQAFSSRLGANVLAIDYRGFADSTGTPSEPGLVIDARAAFDWLIAQGKNAEDILIIGHSLGTGVSGQLAVTLANEGIECKGMVLLSPFASLPRVLEDYNMFGFIPLMKPISLLPGAAGLVKGALLHRFDTLQVVPNITASVLIGHAEDDWDIPDSHSDILFQAFMEPILPEISVSAPLWLTAESLGKLTEQHRARREVLEEKVRTTHISKFGRIDEFVDEKRKVVLVKTLFGGHDYLGIQEGLVDIIGKTFGLAA